MDLASSASSALFAASPLAAPPAAGIASPDALLFAKIRMFGS
jgi:hypothetical protein